MAHFIFITGGVISSLGKGLAAASLGALLKARGFQVRLRKLDPYLNIDPGTLSPYQHGEVYVTDDGTETDLDLGHYERFTDVETTALDYTTTGKIYLNVLNKERQGDYLGATVQVIPHITNEIKAFLTQDTHEEDFIICEVGGTVGDIESLPFLEAARQLRHEKGSAHTLFIHVALVPYVETAGEAKTKPVQHSVKELQRSGIQPDILLCRCDRPLSSDNHSKLALFCNVPLENVIEGTNVPTIYQAPLTYHAAGLDQQVLKHFHLKAPPLSLTKWENLCQQILYPQKEIEIAFVGKYGNFPDTYKSLLQALIHAGASHKTRVNISWVHPEILEDEDDARLHTHLAHVNGVLVPGGFGIRGIEGKIRAISFARTNKIPCLGICLGMQLMVVESARNLAGLAHAHSSEFAVSPHPVVDLLAQWDKQGAAHTYQGREKGLGGTMRLGAYPTYLAHHTKAWEIYGEDKILERHRHRYEVNAAYKEVLEKAGFVFSGFSPDGLLPEIVERVDHPWFMGCQFHPEFKSRPFNPHPFFLSFVEACLIQKQNLGAQDT